MDLKGTEYFDQLLQLNNAYRISCFWCTDTKKWQQTLDNKTTLNFGRYTSIEPIANDPFPEHYFNFIAYNEVQSKADVSGATLTDMQSSSTRMPHSKYKESHADGRRGKNEKLIFHTITLERESTALPVLQKDGTTENVAPITRKYPKDPPTPNAKNAVHSQCQTTGICFRAVIDDSTGVATVTCFSTEAHTFVPYCNEVVNGADNKDTHHVPTALKQLENTTYIFQYHFGKGARPEDPDFTLDVAFKPSPQPLLSLPPPPHSTTPPPLKILQQISSATIAAASENKPCPSTKHSSEGSHTNSQSSKEIDKKRALHRYRCS
ncbi:hypothetical protein Tco_0933347 [Tanacetum coccineum]